MVATVLSDGDDRDPVSDAARSFLDGHIALSARLAQCGRFPAVDVLASASRTMEYVVDAEHLFAAARVRNALALLDRVEDARALGIEPADRATRTAIEAESQLESFLRQSVAGDFRATISWLAALAELLNDADGSH